MTTSTPPTDPSVLLKRPNRWPSGRRFRQRHLRAFRIDQRIGSILLAIAASLGINGLAFWQLYTAKPPPLPIPEPEPIIVMLGDPDPDPEALTDLPQVPAETGDVAASSTVRVPPGASDPGPLPPLAEVPAAAPSAPLAAPASASSPSDDAASLAEVALPPPAPAPVVAATAQDLTDLPAETGEVLAAEVASPEPEPVSTPGNALTEAVADSPPEPASAVDQPVPVQTPRSPSLPPGAADQLARVLETPTVELELPTLPPRDAAEPLRALPPQLRSAPERAPLQEPEIATVAPALAPAVAEAPPPTLPPEPAETRIERADPARPELVVEALRPTAPMARPVKPPVDRALTRVELPEPAAAPLLGTRVAPVAPMVVPPESSRPAPERARPERPVLDLPLAIRPPAAAPVVALPPPRSVPERVRPAEVAVELPREQPALAAPRPAPRAALPPASESTPAASPSVAPALDREALGVAPQAPTRLDPALLAGQADPASAATGGDAEFGLPATRPGAADGLDWNDSIRAATRDQVAEESAARRAARAPWQREEAWLAEDPPARMEQMLRDDPNLVRTMVDFLVGTLASGAAQTPRTIYKVGPDPGVLIQLWLDRHHGDLQMACRRDAGAMPERMLRVLCPGERIEALEFDAARPGAD